MPSSSIRPTTNHAINPTICYTFRRCPYAMRARMTIDYSGIPVEYREVSFRNKPPAMLAASPKGTVPVLINRPIDGQEQVIDESLAIMDWCLQQADPDHWQDNAQAADMAELIAANDQEFKHWLDRYKYAVRFPEHSEHYYRQQAEQFIQQLEERLQHADWLMGPTLTKADVAIFPFVRQFSMVDSTRFRSAPYPHLQQWLNWFLLSQRFQRIMEKRPLWDFNNQPNT